MLLLSSMLRITQSTKEQENDHTVNQNWWDKKKKILHVPWLYVLKTFCTRLWTYLTYYIAIQLTIYLTMYISTYQAASYLLVILTIYLLIKPTQMFSSIYL